MKRLMPSSLIDFLNANPTCHRADLFSISLPNGQTLYATNGQFDISVPDLTPGWSISTDYSINGQQVPWRDPLKSYAYDGTGLGPLQVAVTPGETVSISYISGQWSTGGGGLCDAGGFPGPDTFYSDPGNLWCTGTGVPGTVIHQGMLLGAFADSSGHVLSTFAVGLGYGVVVPAGAAYLLLGNNDGGTYSDNGTAAITVRITHVRSSGATFRASQYGVWSRGRIVSEASSKLSANTMELTCIPQPTTQYPGLNLGILNAALNHLFDGAEIRVYAAYMPIGSYGDISAGLETKWRGYITRPSEISRNKVVFECYDPFALLNLKVPARLFQATCPWSFTDSNCTLDAGSYTESFSAASGSDQRTLTPSSAFSEADGYFAQGVVTCISGGNAGLSQTVKSHASGSLTMMVPWLLPVAAGDTFSVIKGCDKTLATCKATKQTDGTVIDNSLNFGGTPFVPVPQTAI